MNIKETTKEELIQLYITENKSRKEIANLYNVSEPTVKIYLKKFAIKKPRTLITKCQQIQKEIKYGSSTYNNIEKAQKTKLERYGNENYTNRDKAKQTCLEKYGNENYTNIEKTKKTKFERYGDENYTNIEKTKKTKLERYGDENYTNKDKIFQTLQERYGSTNICRPEKAKKSCLEKYGVSNPNKLEKIKNKIKETCLEKYGVEYYFQSNDKKEKTKQSNKQKYGDTNYNNRNKAKETCLEKYGVEYNLQRKEVIAKGHNLQTLNKQIETKKHNNTFNSSQPEEYIYNLLCKKFGEIKRQYTSDLYPFACDFYIPILDLYIDYNGTWTHGKEPYTGTLEQQKIVQLWESKNTKYYNIAKYVWTDLDIRKRQISEENNINRIEFFTIQDFMDWYDKPTMSSFPWENNNE